MWSPCNTRPAPLAGELRAPGLKALLEHLAAVGHAGLCLITSREAVADLAAYRRGEGHPHGAVLSLDLGNLVADDGAKLLHSSGVNRAGAAAIGPEDRELKAASRQVRGHALTLSLLGRYLALAFEGDIRRKDLIDLGEVDQETGGHAFRVMAAYETWLAREGEQGARELAALRLLGLFDRPASPESLAALRAAPPIAGLTEPLVDLSPHQWRTTLKRLEDCGLVYPAEGEDKALDAHPLVRAHLARSLREGRPAAWREGHRRLYEQLEASVPYQPEGLTGLQPLYQAVAHGCLAGLPAKAFDEVYRDRILRGTGKDGFYSTRQLGASGADLEAVACLFEQAWLVPSSALDGTNQAWLLSDTAFRLRALGRLREALEPARIGADMAVKQQDWRNAAARLNNLSELQLSLGYVTAALANGERSVEYADRSGSRFQRMARRTTLATILHQHGEGKAAMALFKEAETLQAKVQPDFPFLDTVRGFRYCGLLLSEAERAAWAGLREDATLLRRCRDVMERARWELRWTQEERSSLITMGLLHLTAARCALYTALLSGEPPHAAQYEIARAVDGLRAAGRQDFVPLGLLTRAWLRHRLGDTRGAQADLDEAQRIATRGGMRLHQADIHLTRARLLHDRAELAKARARIEQCEYRRRLPELEDAERAARGW